MISAILPWQQTAWKDWMQMRERLPHAILFYGPVGIGKTQFVEHVAASLLCESPGQNGHACGTCQSCNWFSQYGHPDYRRVRPEVLEDEEGAAEGAAEVVETKKSSKTKAPSKDIRIEQVRALSDFMNVSTHRSGQRVVMLHPAEALNTASANAILKTLEEPPPNTVFLLISNNLSRLLPTILSRCRKFALHMPSNDESLKWLDEQGCKDADVWLAELGGAPLAALESAQSETREGIDELLSALCQPSVEIALKTAEKLQKSNIPDLVSCLQRWQSDLFSHKLANRIRYYPRYQKQIAALAKRVETDDLLQSIKQTTERKAVAEHPLSGRLVLEDMLLSYSALFMPA